MLKFSTTRREAIVGLAASALLSATKAQAQDYPARPVRWLVGYPAGGGSDVLARLLAASMAGDLGQSLVIENRPGAASNLAAGEAARSAPDGYTVFSAGLESHVYNPVIYKKIPFDPDKDFRAVGPMARIHLALGVKKDSTIKTARELFERAKAEPQKLNYGSPGLGSPHHLTMERLARLAGAKILHVPYRGTAPVLNDLMVGVIESAVIDLAAGASALKDGSIRPLAVCSAQRLAVLPDVPTIQEALGFDTFDAYAWQAIVVPSATPDAAVAKLSAALSAALKRDAVANRMKEIGLDPFIGGPADVERLVKAEREVWWPVVKELGLALE